MIYKKGLSPLISSILLISISITVVALMTVMSGNIVDDSMDNIGSSQKEINCNQIDVVLKQYDGKDMVCYNYNEIDNANELIIFLQNINYKSYYGTLLEIFKKNFDIEVFDDYKDLDINVGENLVLKYNITAINISEISDMQIKIGLKDKNKKTYFCSTNFLISSEKIIKCSDLYK